MTNYENHYKDRQPEETVEIIKNFFINKGLIVKQIQEYQSEINTFSCTYGLFLDNIQILKANGKGMTYEYSLASCFAELYERFCAYFYHNMTNPFIIKDLWEKRFDLKHYYINQKEKELQVKDILNDNYTNYFFKTDSKQNLNTIIKYWFKIYQNDKIIGIPYYNLNNELDSYKNFSIIAAFEGTTGFSAGNTLEEALVQGCCELYERKCLYEFWHYPQDKYYYLNLNCIDEKLKEKIFLMKKYGFNCFIYDLSYNFNIPACMLVAINQYNHKCYIKISSNIIFNIAVERCITEFYQGMGAFKPGSNIKVIPYKKEYSDKIYKQETIMMSGLESNSIQYLPIFLFNNSQQIDNYNTEYFLNSINISNKELLQVIQKINKKHNLTFLYSNLSLSDQIYAISVIFKEKNFLKQEIKKQQNNYKNEEVLNLELTVYQQLLLLKNKKLYYNDIKNLLNIMIKIDKINPSILQMLMNAFMCPCFCKDEKNNYDYYNILYLLNQQLQDISFKDKNSIYECKYNEFILYTNLINNNKYTEEKIKDIFKQLDYLDYEKIKNINNIYSLIDFIFISNTQEFYQSEFYKKFLNLFI